MQPRLAAFDELRVHEPPDANRANVANQTTMGTIRA